MNKYLLSTAMAALLLYAGPAMATTVTAGDTVTVDWTQSVNSTEGPPLTTTLSGELTLSNFVFTTNSVTFHLVVENDTQQGTLTTAQWQSIKLMSFGFDTDPDATSVSDTSALFTTELNSQQPLPSIGHLDFCAYAANNCSGGNQNFGLAPGDSAEFNVTLAGFPTSLTSLDLGIGATEEFGVKFQTGFGSFEFTNPPDGNPPPPPPPPPPLPEPGSLMLLGAALSSLGGIMWWRRRKNNDTMPLTA